MATRFWCVYRQLFRKKKLRAYIQNQKQHHAKKTYKDEFLAILVAHGIEYDPKFVFEEEHYG